MRCLGCQYDLSDLALPRCPECGREFDPGQPTTFDTLEARQQRLRKWQMKSVLVGIGVLSLLVLMISNWRYNHFSWKDAALIAMGLLVCAVAT